MTKQEVIERFCKLSALVGESMKQKYAQDCFCKNPDASFQFQKEIIDYINEAVEEKMLNDERNKEFLLSIDAPSDYQHY